MANNITNTTAVNFRLFRVYKSYLCNIGILYDGPIFTTRHTLLVRIISIVTIIIGVASFVIYKLYFQKIRQKEPHIPCFEDIALVNILMAIVMLLGEFYGLLEIVLASFQTSTYLSFLYIVEWIWHSKSNPALQEAFPALSKFIINYISFFARIAAYFCWDYYFIRTHNAPVECLISICILEGTRIFQMMQENAVYVHYAVRRDVPEYTTVVYKILRIIGEFFTLFIPFFLYMFIGNMPYAFMNCSGSNNTVTTFN